MKSSLAFLATAALVSACATSNPKKDTNQNPAASTSDQQQVVRCFGINSCAAYAKCAVTAADIDATKEKFGDKFASSELHECSGLAKCAASGGQLNWVQVSQQECGEKGGFLIETAADGTKELKTL
ncbi:MAG: hypothetical protein RLZZ488_2654 [Pseudomonadota bacterium]|jgi:hypothetical protein